MDHVTMSDRLSLFMLISMGKPFSNVGSFLDELSFLICFMYKRQNFLKNGTQNEAKKPKLQSFHVKVGL